MLHFVKTSRAKISFIIVYSVDRFSRSGGNAIYITEQLKNRGVIVISVSQPTDTTTPSGSLQQNIQFIFSEYDNQLRKEKCMAGVRDALYRGEWCQRPPYGYDIVRREGKRILVLNEKGKLLRKAFHWKADENLSIEECKERLKLAGLNIYHQKLAKVFRNPFYCGMIAHTALEGKVIEGKHEKMVDQEVFLKVNDLLDGNSHGYSINRDNEHVPLKNFVKCAHCGGSIPGYIVKKKNLWYYKCRKKGCCNNKRAKILHDLFEELLARIKADEKFEDFLTTQMVITYNQTNRGNLENEHQLKAQLQDLQRKYERLEERYILEEITQEMFLKYQAKFREEIAGIQDRLEKFTAQVSNLDECAGEVFQYAVKLPDLWDDAPYKEKVDLQKMLFPEGITYDKKTDECRTTTIKPTFLWIVYKSQTYTNEKVGIPELNLSYSHLVEPAEPKLNLLKLKKHLLLIISATT